ncbi:hypothetical protein Micbo1qcDRAFT_192891 [Microdochium bolleyi]|uniref:Flavin reductase like domain-containing protein n=1 Tax=Microdochium bolleyi TaxID=196109 RepID=A0A136JFT0_9PEZI|nr:hypothetical protein Micbo1qcDRAFT_192891 [Microdochium bolleyi]
MAPSTSPPSKTSLSIEETPFKEGRVGRNKHGQNFKAVEASRPDYDRAKTLTYSKTPNPDWQPGDGASVDHTKHKCISFEPYEPGRDVVHNYKLMITSVVPRPIALASTVSPDGKTKNLAPFSYFQAVSTDPPLYSLAFLGGKSNDTLDNLLATKEICISMTSDWLIEAANFASVNTPSNVSEWDLTGLTPAPSVAIRPPHVAESPFSVECRLYSQQDIYSKTKPDVRTSTLVVVEAVRYHVWEDVIDANRSELDHAKARPVFRSDGQTYGSCKEVFELPRPERFSKLVQDEGSKVTEILGGAGLGANKTAGSNL